jgi:hypothetical protein
MCCSVQSIKRKFGLGPASGSQRDLTSTLNDRFAPIPVIHELISIFVKSYQGMTDSISCVTREPTIFIFFEICF